MGGCSCGSWYIGETKRNAEVRWNKHYNPTESSELSKHLRKNLRNNLISTNTRTLKD